MEIDIESFTFYEPIKKMNEIQSNRFGSGEITIQKAFKVTMEPLKILTLKNNISELFRMEKRHRCLLKLKIKN